MPECHPAVFDMRPYLLVLLWSGIHRQQRDSGHEISGRSASVGKLNATADERPSIDVAARE
jgi:hypothetical protein